MSGNPSSSSAKPSAQDEIDIEKILNREASAYQREVEVDRILKAFKLNPYEILDIEETASMEEVKKKYRQLSLFIHPDKCPHARAPEAFDILKKAESELSNKDQREELDSVINQARNLVLKALNLPVSTSNSDPKVQGLDPPFKTRLRAQSKLLLIDEEVRRRKAIKMNLANEGLEARKKDEEVAQRKRKAEEDKNWEDNREQRVDSWRNFANSSKKKKKTKVTVLG
ncbi:J domain-containing protein spf31 [Psilocybe cubensis]|uniref:J domain-containing protein n=2 Tax=Psilocybe cubensis TaxID=181762 RepID=A0A8H7Y2Q4_PSICU|nr:J domain-containing protein spf31 [Psilocybe cubensis]KAH9481603.1 J domain-containing protein spf31 [Psilocybe cubensis]